MHSKQSKGCKAMAYSLLIMRKYCCHDVTSSVQHRQMSLSHRSYVSNSVGLFPKMACKPHGHHSLIVSSIASYVDLSSSPCFRSSHATTNHLPRALFVRSVSRRVVCSDESVLYWYLCSYSTARMQCAVQSKSNAM